MLAGAAIGALIGGRLADLFGRRKLLIATAIIFAVGAILCAVAPSALIAGSRTHYRRLWNRIVLQRRACLYLRGCSRGCPRLAGFSFPACNHCWNSPCLPGGLCVRRNPGLAMDVRSGRNSRGDLWFGYVFPAGESALAIAARAPRNRPRHAGAHSRDERRRGGISGNRAVRHKSAGERPFFGSVRALASASAGRRNRVGNFPANNRDKYRHLLRAAHYSERREFRPLPARFLQPRASAR